MKIIQTKINRITIIGIETREERSALSHEFVDKGFNIQALDKHKEGYYINMFKEAPIEEISEEELRKM